MTRPPKSQGRYVATKSLGSDIVLAVESSHSSVFGGKAERALIVGLGQVNSAIKM
jgi:hypothetical protein